MEVASYLDESQFEPGESPMECGFFAVSLNKHAGKPGKLPEGTGEDIDVDADRWYVEQNGRNDFENKKGMSLSQLYYCLHVQAGLSFRYCPPDLEYIRAWVKHGYPVLIACPEASIIDVELGEKVPYGWKPVGNHIITVSGIADNSNLLCRDPASVSMEGVRKGPRQYDASKISIVTATVVILPFLSLPANNFDPTKEEPTPITKTIQYYVIRPGDTLAAIASEHHTSFSQLYALNQKVLEQTAQKYGYLNSRDGNLIFPDTKLLLP